MTLDAWRGRRRVTGKHPKPAFDELCSPVAAQLSVLGETRMKIHTIVGVFVGLTMFSVTAVADDTDTLISLDKQWGESEGSAALDPLLLDSVMGVSGGGLGNKNSMLEAADSAEPSTEPYMAGDYKVQFLSDDIAVMVHSTAAPEPHWSLHVWQRVDGAWRVAASASVPVEDY
jgi:hypothetical protein